MSPPLAAAAAHSYFPVRVSESTLPGTVGVGGSAVVVDIQPCLFLFLDIPKRVECHLLYTHTLYNFHTITSCSPFNCDDSSRTPATPVL